MADQHQPPVIEVLEDRTGPPLDPAQLDQAVADLLLSLEEQAEAPRQPAAEMTRDRKS
jgi:hypothetical protein